jgi:hypothetical protein
MRTLRVLTVYLLAAIALGAACASAATGSSVLVLKEEGARVPMGTELELEIKTDWHQCKLPPHGHLVVNGAKKDIFSIPTSVEQKPSCEYTGEASFVHYGFEEVTEVALKASGRATLTGVPIKAWYFLFGSPALTCRWDFRKLSGGFPISGSALIEGTGAGALNKKESGYEGEKNAKPCERHISIHFTAVVRGHNGKPLETELVG